MSFLLPFTRGLWTLALVLLAAACAEPPLSLRAEEKPRPQKEYGRIFDKWSRDGRVHSWAEMDTMLLVRATLQSEPLQQAYAERYLSVYRIEDPQEAARIRTNEAQVAKDQVAFLVRVAGHGYPATDLIPEKGFWRMSLLVDEDKNGLSPTTVEQVKNRQALEEALYDNGLALPTPFVRFFHVRFPKTNAAGQTVLSPERKSLVLRISGPHGHTELTWRFTP